MKLNIVTLDSAVGRTPTRVIFLSVPQMHLFSGRDENFDFRYQTTSSFCYWTIKYLCFIHLGWPAGWELFSCGRGERNYETSMYGVSMEWGCGTFLKVRVEVLWHWACGSEELVRGFLLELGRGGNIKFSRLKCNIAVTYVLVELYGVVLKTLGLSRCRSRRVAGYRSISSIPF